MIPIIFKISKGLRLTPSTTFLAAFLSKHYLNKIEQEVPYHILDDIAQTCTLLACKMRERDIYCPMIPHVMEVAGKKKFNKKGMTVSINSIKRREISVANFFEWNICMLTFYDFVEQFLAMGCLFADDKIKSETINELDREQEQNLSQENNKKKLEENFGQQGEKDVKLLSEISKRKLIENIERRCFDLSIQITHFYLTDMTKQKLLAYIILVLSREDNGLSSPDKPLLRNFYGISREAKIEDLKNEIRKNCPDKKDKLFHDLVIRSYDEDGNEVLPSFIRRRMEEREQINFHHHPNQEQLHHLPPVHNFVQQGHPGVPMQQFGQPGQILPGHFHTLQGQFVQAPGPVVTPPFDHQRMPYPDYQMGHGPPQYHQMPQMMQEIGAPVSQPPIYIQYGSNVNYIIQNQENEQFPGQNYQNLPIQHQDYGPLPYEEFRPELHDYNPQYVENSGLIPGEPFYQPPPEYFKDSFEPTDDFNLKFNQLDKKAAEGNPDYLKNKFVEAAPLNDQKVEKDSKKFENVVPSFTDLRIATEESKRIEEKYTEIKKAILEDNKPSVAKENVPTGAKKLHSANLDNLEKEEPAKVKNEMSSNYRSSGNINSLYSYDKNGTFKKGGGPTVEELLKKYSKKNVVHEKARQVRVSAEEKFKNRPKIFENFTKIKTEEGEPYSSKNKVLEKEAIGNIYKEYKEKLKEPKKNEKNREELKELVKDLGDDHTYLNRYSRRSKDKNDA